jgi:hypothetical protein
MDLPASEVLDDPGAPPGTDEVVIARLRAMFPDAPDEPIRYVVRLPEASTLEGWVRGDLVYLKKTYQGPHVGGFLVGDKVVGHVVENHSVHYRGRLAADRREIEGSWWIDPRPGSLRDEGLFILRRIE